MGIFTFCRRNEFIKFHREKQLTRVMQLANFAFVKKSFAAVGVSIFLFDSAVFLDCRLRCR